MSLAALGGILSGGGVLLGGVGGLKANRKNKEQKQDLQARYDFLSGMSEPWAQALEQGYQPGGQYEAALMAPGMRAAFGEGQRALQGAEAGAWKYGGGGGILQGQRRFSELGAGNAADAVSRDARLRALANQAQIQLRRRQTQWATEPTQYTNPYAGIAQAAVQTGAQLMTAGRPSR